MATILIIEDNLNHANMLRRVLTHHGHTLTHAATALEGLRLAAQFQPDLILLDLDLPDLDGRIVAMRLRSDPRFTQVPIIAVTGHSGRQEEQLARGYGCDDYITKPIEVRNFPRQIKRYLK